MSGYCNSIICSNVSTVTGYKHTIVNSINSAILGGGENFATNSTSSIILGGCKNISDNTTNSIMGGSYRSCSKSSGYSAILGNRCSNLEYSNGVFQAKNNAGFLLTGKMNNEKMTNWLINKYDVVIE